MQRFPLIGALFPNRYEFALRIYVDSYIGNSAIQEVAIMLLDLILL